MAAVPGATMTTGPKTGTYFSELFPLATDEYLRNNSGRYLYEAGSGDYSLCPASVARIDCWAFDCFQVIHDGNQGKTPYPQSTTFAAEAYYVTGTRDIFEAANACWIPSADTLVATDVGTQCELIIASSGVNRIQQVKPSVVTTPVVKIVGVDLINNYALVHAIRL
jgi:hypothetical protein